MVRSTAFHVDGVPGAYREMSFSPSGRSSPVGDTCRHRVCRVMPSPVQSSLTFVSGLPWRPWRAGVSRASSCSACPPFRPRAREAGDGSFGNQLAFEFGRCEDLQPDTAFGQVVDDVDQVAQVPTEPVEFPDDQGRRGARL